MAITSLCTNIDKQSNYPKFTTILAPNNCGTIILQYGSSYTDQMVHELPNITINIWVEENGSRVLFASRALTMQISEQLIEIGDVLVDIPGSCIFSLIPEFDNNAIDSHNEDVINSGQGQLWNTPTTQFPLQILFDDTNVVCGGSGGGGGGTVTVDTEVNAQSTNPVENRAIYSFVKSEAQVVDGAISALANRGAKNFLQKPETMSSQSENVTASVDEEGLITVRVASDIGNNSVIVYYDVTIPAGTYIFSCGENSGTSESSLYDCFIWDTGESKTLIRDNDDSEPYSEATIPAGTYQLRIRMRPGATAGTYIFKPMLRDARIEDTTYVPPSMSNAELTAIVGNKNYIYVNGVRLYISSTAPTGDIPDGSVGVGW